MTYTERLNKLIQRLAHMDQGLYIKNEVRNNRDGRWELFSKHGSVVGFTHVREDFSMTHEVMAEYAYHKLVEWKIEELILQLAFNNKTK